LSVASGDSSGAVGGTSQAAQTRAVAIGSNAVATAPSAVAIGSGSLANSANAVSVGSAGNERHHQFGGRHRADRLHQLPRTRHWTTFRITL